MTNEPEDRGGWRPITPPTRPQASSNAEWMPKTLGGWVAAAVLLAIVIGGIMAIT